jgi:hypothetical protein
VAAPRSALIDGSWAVSLTRYELQQLARRDRPRPRITYRAQGSLFKCIVKHDNGHMSASSPMSGWRSNPDDIIALHGDVSVQAERPKRGVINEFSRRSRKRLIELTASLELTRYRPRKGRGGCQYATFLTLTYPDKYPSAKTAKKHLQTFVKRMLRRKGFENASGLWRLEFQKRGAPHFHLILFNAPYWDKRDVQKQWGEVIGFDDPFTKIEAIRTERGVMSYVSKYVAKIPAPPAQDDEQTPPPPPLTRWTLDSWRSVAPLMYADTVGTYAPHIDANGQIFGQFPVTHLAHNYYANPHREIDLNPLANAHATPDDCAVSSAFSRRENPEARGGSEAIRPAGEGTAAWAAPAEGGSGGFNYVPYLTAGQMVGTSSEKEKESVGRFWGIIQRKNLPLAPVEETVLEIAQSQDVAMFMRAVRYLASEIWDGIDPLDIHLGFTLFMDDPYQFYRKIIEQYRTYGAAPP